VDQEIKIPIRDELLLESLPDEPKAMIYFNAQLAIASDVGQVSFNATASSGAATDLDHHFGDSAHGPGDLLSLSWRQ
jgi:hypothetical protein